MVVFFGSSVIELYLFGFNYMVCFLLGINVGGIDEFVEVDGRV